MDKNDVNGAKCLKDVKGEIVAEKARIMEIWKDYMSKLFNEENIWDGDTICDVKEGPECRIKLEEVKIALGKMKTGKASGHSGIDSDILKATGEMGLEWLTDLCNEVISEGKIPVDWQKSVIIPVFKGKGDPMQCESYRAIKLLEHVMKLLERILESRIREQIQLDEMQFGFTKGKGTTDAIFIVRQMQERYREKHKKLNFAFIDLEKAFDRVPREVTRWALRKAGVDEWLVRTVMSMYNEVWSIVRTEQGESEPFEIKVGLHQGSVLSPLLFIIVMDQVTRDVKEGLPWELVYADDLILEDEETDGLINRANKWKNALESKGLRVNVKKTKFMVMSYEKVVQENSDVKWPAWLVGQTDSRTDSGIEEAVRQP